MNKKIIDGTLQFALVASLLYATYYSLSAPEFEVIQLLKFIPSAILLFVMICINIGWPIIAGQDFSYISQIDPITGVFLFAALILTVSAAFIITETEKANKVFSWALYFATFSAGLEAGKLRYKLKRSATNSQGKEKTGEN